MAKHCILAGFQSVTPGPAIHPSVLQLKTTYHLQSKIDSDKFPASSWTWNTRNLAMSILNKRTSLWYINPKMKSSGKGDELMVPLCRYQAYIFVRQSEFLVMALETWTTKVNGRTGEQLVLLMLLGTIYLSDVARFAHMFLPLSLYLRLLHELIRVPLMSAIGLVRLCYVKSKDWPGNRGPSLSQNRHCKNPRRCQRRL